MSELKAISSGEIYNKIEYEGSCITDDLYYPKSEADKVIAYRDCEIKKLKDSLNKLLKAKTEQIMQEVIQKFLIYGEGFVPVEHAIKLVAEIRNNKYKRCLAMAERCSERFHHYVALSAFSPNKGAIPFYDKMLHKAYRWKYKWLERADKFKEA